MRHERRTVPRNHSYVPVKNPGKVTRFRLDRGGDRQANAAVYVIVLARMSADKGTRAHVERRLAEVPRRQLAADLVGPAAALAWAERGRQVGR